jgi:hypothetical protein
MIKGMCKTYSRCGKTCDERFNNVKEDRVVMLLGERPKTLNSPGMQIDRKNNEELKDVIGEINSHRDRLMTASAKHLSPVFLAQGRDEYYTSVSSRDKVPPCGYYNIQNQNLKKCKSIPNFNKKPKLRNKVQERSNSPSEKEKVSKTQIKGITFQRQLPRPDISTFAPNVSDKRFDSVKEYPKIFSKSRNIVSPCFTKGTGHDLILPETMNSRIYNPNREFVMKNSSNVALDFDKFTSRKPNVYNITDIDYNRKNFKQLDRNVPSIDFGKISSRPESNLPFFMVVRNI